MASTISEFQCSGKVVAAVDLTASNSLAQAYDSLFVGTGGDVAVVCYKSQTTTSVFQNVANSTFVPVAIYKLLATSTTASNIKGLTTGR